MVGLQPDTARTAIQIPTLSVDEPVECIFFNILKSLRYYTCEILTASTVFLGIERRSKRRTIKATQKGRC